QRFVDRTSVKAGEDCPDTLAEALRTTQTMVCLYSPSFFRSEHCGKEMQVLLKRRRAYADAHGGKKPSNIIPVIWHPTTKARTPRTLPDIEYAPRDSPGLWVLGDK